MIRKPLFFILVLSLFAAFIQVAYTGDEDLDPKYSLSQNEGQMGLKMDRGTEANGLVLKK